MPLHFISVQHGLVEVMRPSGVTFRAAVGTRIRQDDVLRFASDAHVTIVCADLTTAMLPREPGGVAGNPCKAENSILQYRGEPHSILRTEPILLATLHGPPYSLTVSDRPQLRWLSDPADPQRNRSYTLYVHEGDQLLARVRLRSSPAPYPPQVPPLEPGRRMTFTIHPEGSTTIPPRVELERLPEAKSTAARNELSRVHALGLDQAGVVLAAARIYARHRALYEALNELIVAGPLDIAAIRLTRGEQLLAGGYAAPAKTDLERAVQLARDAGDLRTEAAAHDLLAATFSRLGDRATAIREYQAALALFQKLGEGDTARVRNAIRLLQGK